MRTIIAGSRNINEMTFIKVIELCPWLYEVTEVVSGTAKGVDKWGENWAAWQDLPVVKFPADWDKYGKRAGFIRNAEMADYSDALIAIWDGQSRGTKNMIDTARTRGLLVFVWNRLTNSCEEYND